MRTIRLGILAVALALCAVVRARSEDPTDRLLATALGFVCIALAYYGERDTPG